MTLQQLSDMIQRGQQLQSALVGDAITVENGGTSYKGWNKISVIGSLIYGLNSKVLIQDYDSLQTLNIYKNLDCFVGGKFLTGVTLDPNAQQQPGVVYVNNNIIVNTGAYGKYEFTDQTIVSLFQNYHTDIFPLFGNGAVIQIFTLQGDGSYMPDYGTTPDIVYDGGDSTKDILSMIWTYPVPTSGYIQINGANNNGTSPAGLQLPIPNSSAVLLSNDQLNTLYPFAVYPQLVLLPNANAKYLKLDNSPAGLWEYEPYNPNT